MNSESQLSQAQIDQLIAFTKTKDVPFEDVRFEIVDHLASDIESQIDKDPTIVFDQALKRAYGKFPITGFYKFIEDKEASLRNFWSNRLFLCLKNYLIISKFIVAVILGISVFNLVTHLALVSQSILAFCGLLGTPIIMYLYITKPLKRLKQKYLLVEAFDQQVKIATSIISTSYISFIWMHTYNTYLVIVFSVLITINCFLIYALMTGDIKKLLITELRVKFRHLGIEL